MPQQPSVAIAGVTGAVGEMLALLEERNFPHAELRLFASRKSAGSTLPYRAGQLRVDELTESSFRGIDIALFSAGSGISKQFAPAAIEAGATVIDNSSAYRMDPLVPLVIPEINPHVLPASLPKPRGIIIANPNCSAIVMLVALTPLHRAFGIESIIVSTYQAASGAGARGMDELVDQSRRALAGETVTAAPGGLFHEPYAFNLFSHNTAIDPDSGLNVEERKVIEETAKIWRGVMGPSGDASAVRVAPTCIRVPVLGAHSESIHVTFARPATTEQVRATLAAAPGVRVVDDRSLNHFPTPLKASGGDDILVGRIRPSPLAEVSASGSRAFDLFVSGDQIRKGAALNAIQIAEHLIRG